MMQAQMLPPPDLVSAPPHYCQDPTGIECIELTSHLSFCLGNAVKYVWRAGEKGSAEQDYRKSAWYLRREASRMRGMGWLARRRHRAACWRASRCPACVAYLDHPLRNHMVCCVLARIALLAPAELDCSAAFLETHADWLHIYP